MVSSKCDCFLNMLCHTLISLEDYSRMDLRSHDFLLGADRARTLNRGVTRLTGMMEGTGQAQEEIKHHKISYFLFK